MPSQLTNPKFLESFLPKITSLLINIQLQTRMQMDAAIITIVDSLITPIARQSCLSLQWKCTVKVQEVSWESIVSATTIAAEIHVNSLNQIDRSKTS